MPLHLAEPAAALFGRFLLSALFLHEAWSKVTGYSLTIAYMQAFGVPAQLLPLAIAFELGCGLVIDGELEWLTGGVVPSTERGSIYDQIEASGAPALLLEHYRSRPEYHTPWSIGREVSHLFRQRAIR